MNFKFLEIMDFNLDRLLCIVKLFDGVEGERIFFYDMSRLK